MKFDEEKWEKYSKEQEKNPRCWICKRNAEEVIHQDYSGVVGDEKKKIFHGINEVESSQPIQICIVCLSMIELMSAFMFERDYKDDFLNYEDMDKILKAIKKEIS